MKYSVALSQGVEQELEAAALWLEEKRTGYGIKFIEAFDEAVAHIGKNPLAFSVKYKSCREIKLGRFSYVLIYRVFGELVLIVKLIHTSRRPAKRYKK